MKTNKSRLFMLLALGGLMAVGPIARADDAPAQTPPPAPAPGTDDKAPAGRPGARQQLEKLFTAIKATDEEKDKLKPIFKERSEKLKTLREDTSLSKEDRAAKRKEIMKDINAKVKEVLTPDQFEEYQKLQKEQVRGARNGGQPATPPADSTPKN